MWIKSSLRGKMIIAIFIGCFVPYLLGGLYLNAFLKDWLYNNSISNSRQILGQVDELIDRSLISDMEEEVTQLASLYFVTNAEKQLKNYVNYSEGSEDTIESDAEKELDRYFRSLKDSHKTTNFIFLGTEDGGYMEYPQFSPSQSYDPRQRPWYQNTIHQSNIIMSEPYLTNVTKDMVVSFTKPVVKEGEAIGVVGISVNLKELTDSVRELKIGSSGYVMLLSPEYKFIVAPNNKNWILKTPEELGLKDFDPLYAGTSATFEMEVDGKLCVLNTLTSQSHGLHVVTVMNKAEILKNAGVITSILYLIYLITLGVIFIVVYQISKYITKPILEISSVISHMTDFDFSFEENTRVDDYAKRSDEIGTVSAALIDMNNNYRELMTQVKYIDNEIHQIDIEKKSQLQVELPGKNPFHNVIGSMNALMSRIYQYVKELRDKNVEMQMKNEQLTASEEELTAQLEEIEAQKEYINYLAYHDALTGLPNRRNFIEILRDKINSGSMGAVILLDIDDFKGINDTRGHAFGDRVLESIAVRLRTINEPNLTISRFGGDEFLVLLESNNNHAKLEHSLDEICRLFDSKFKIDDLDVEISFSMGISLFPLDSTDVNQLIMKADLAMYSVKAAGKNGYRLFDTAMLDWQIKKSNIETILRDAIDGDGFLMVYQPQVDIKSGKIHSYEALLRLKEHNIPPNVFIDIAEKNGMIIKIGRIVTRKVIEQIAVWQTTGLKAKPVAINFSAIQLHDSSYIDYMTSLLEEYKVEPSSIEIEITENIFLENQQITMAFLTQIKNLGIRIAIDDFGTGYSSLHYLTFLPVDIIKLDRSLSMKFLEIENIKVMDSLISLVHSLGLTVVAEGIEQLEQVQRLSSAGCDYIQGYFFSKPVGAECIPGIHEIVYDNYRIS